MKVNVVQIDSRAAANKGSRCTTTIKKVYDLYFSE